MGFNIRVVIVHDGDYVLNITNIYFKGIIDFKKNLHKY